MTEEPEVVVRVGNKEVKIDEERLRVLREYVRTSMTLEQLAERLGLENYEEAYELVKKIPAWILWSPPSLWKRQLASYLKSQAAAEGKQ
ncbi:MAG: hypothetical protein ABWK00_04765 [Desulfurococcaceae archaeon]